MKKLKKFIFKISKKILFKYIMTFSLIFTILFSSIYSCVSVSYGAEVLATGAKIVGYIGSTLGIVDKATGGGVTKMGGDTTSKIEQWWADNFNNGEIYENASGEYVFSGSATSELYSALSANSSTDARVVSSFGNRAFTSSPSYTSAGLAGMLNDGMSQYNIKDYLIVGGQNINDDKTTATTKLIAYDLSNVAYLLVNGNQIYFYNSSGNKVTVTAYLSAQSYTSGDFGNVIYTNGSTYYINVIPGGGSTNNSKNCQNICFESDFSGTDYIFNNFPMGKVGFDRFYANKSIILCKNGSAGMSLYQSNDNRMINNYYTTLPSVSADTINNNDWDSIYNSYVNNVSNESNTYYNSDTDSYDDTALREAMKKYTDNIQSAIESGAQDIAKQVDYLNEWMSKIYTLLGQIADLIDQNESGGTSGATDLTTVEGKLTAIQNYLETISGDTLEIQNVVSNLEDINNQLTSMQSDLDYIQDNYVILSNIYNYMLSNPWGGGGHFKEPTDQPYDKWFKYLDDDDFPYGEILSKYNVLEQLLKGVAPFCFFAFASLVVNSLDVAPVEPIFDIPIQMDNALMSVDENLTIDLTIFDSILPVTNALIIILWTMVLLWSSFYLISHLLTILQL